MRKEPVLYLYWNNTITNPASPRCLTRSIQEMADYLKESLEDWEGLIKKIQSLEDLTNG